jgi:hypothetical protein
MNFRFDRFLQQLDISGNFLGTLDEKSLQGVGESSLEILDASNSYIYHVNEKAFEGQSKLQAVDLSRNKLDFIEPNTFRKNRFLITLSLANNEMLKLPEGGSFLNTQSLKVLDLSTCNLSNIPPNTFRELPKLEALYLSYNKLKVLPQLQSVKRLNILDLSYNYLTYLNSEVLSASPKLSHLNLSYNELSTLNTTVTSKLAKVSNREDLKGNPWVCDCAFHTVFSLCCSHGVDLEIVCSSPPKCNNELWTECYKAGCDGGYTGVGPVEDMVTIGNTAVPSEGLDNRGNKKASDSEEMKVTLYTRQPSQGLENHGHQTASNSFGIQEQKQENEIILYVRIVRNVSVIVACVVLLVLAIKLRHSISHWLLVTDHAEADFEASLPLKSTEC